MSFTLFINDTNVEVAMEDIVLQKAGKLECYLLSSALFTKNYLNCYIIERDKRSPYLEDYEKSNYI